MIFGATMLLWRKLRRYVWSQELFFCGHAVFALGSAMVGLSPSIGVMIASRALQGIGAAMLNPSAISLIALSFPAKERSVAFGITAWLPALEWLWDM